MQELQYFHLYSHSYLLLIGTKVLLFFKFTEQTRHFMTRLDTLSVPINNLNCHIPDKKSSPTAIFRIESVFRLPYFG